MKSTHDDATTTMTRAQTVLLAVFTAVLGLVHTYLFRHAVHSDAISYLDIATAYLHRDWPNAINAYWSPLYSWMIACVLWCFQPVYWEAGAVHAVNFAAFCVVALSFYWLSRQAALYFRIPPRDRVWIAGNYAIFLWATLGMITLRECTPDLIGMAALFLVFGLLVRAKTIGGTSPSWR
jgi:hypothetical protein